MPSADVLISFRSAPYGLRRTPLKEFARTLKETVAGGREFHCLIADDRELRRLNRRFLGHDYATDVLSFPADRSLARNGSRAIPLGDVVISAGRAGAQAREFGHSRLDEIRILMLHGVLHLKGMDHHTDRGQMARAEARWRKKLNLPVGLIARVSS